MKFGNMTIEVKMGWNSVLIFSDNVNTSRISIDWLSLVFFKLGWNAHFDTSVMWKFHAFIGNSIKLFNFLICAQDYLPIFCIYKSKWLRKYVSFVLKITIYGSKWQLWKSFLKNFVNGCMVNKVVWQISWVKKCKWFGKQVRMQWVDI